MKPKRLLLASAFGLGLALALMAVLGLSFSKKAYAVPSATIRYVLDAGGVDTGDCTDPNNPCQTIQYALGQAESGDTIQVANRFSPAIYTGTVFITKSVTLEGGWNATGFSGGLLWGRPSPCEAFRTTLDAQGAGRVISITGNITPTIDCFTITGGDASGLGGDHPANDAGGGIYSQDAAPIIAHNVITSNYGCVGVGCSNYGRGGGIYLLNAPATAVISGNLIANNQADKDSTWGQGGGIMLRDSDAQVFSNTIEYNRAGHSAGYGGGITIKDGTPTVADNTIRHNVAGQGVQGLGGGIFVWSTTPTTIERNLIEYNQAINGPGDPTLISRGGGICYLGDPDVSAIIRDNIIRDNVASPYSHQTGEGGGMYLSGLVTPSSVSGNTLEWNVASWNDNGNGGGIYVNDSEATLTDNLIFDNSATWSGDHGQGGGLHVNGGAMLIQSNVITNNAGGGFPGFPSTTAGYGGGMVISGCLATVRDNWIAGNRGTHGQNSGMGGGIYGYSGTLQIEGNTITDNRAGPEGQNGLGGGVYITRSLTAALTGNQIYSNTAERGGGIYGEESTLAISGNTFSDGSASAGGGAYLYASDHATFVDNHFTNNDAISYGGGVYVQNSQAVAFTANLFTGNSVVGNGGGGYILFSDDVTFTANTILSNTDAGVCFYGCEDALLDNNVIAGNGAGVSITGHTTRLRHNTIAHNGTGVNVWGYWDGDGTAILTNNILVSHTVGITVSAGNTATLEATLWGDGAWANDMDWGGAGHITTGTVNVRGDPAFVDPDGGNYHIGLGSAAIDAGLDAGVMTDIDDEPRLGLPDIGADEYVRQVYLPLVLRDL